MAELKRFSALKDLLQVLTDYFSADGVLSTEYHNDLSDCINNYKQAHDEGSHLSESHKIVDDLKELSNTSAARGDAKLPLVLTCLKELSQVLHPEDVIEKFEETILRPVLSPYGQTRQTLADAREVLLFCLIPLDSDDKNRGLQPIHAKVFDIYIRKSQEVLRGAVQMSSLPATKFTISTVEKLLLDYGDKCPQEFLETIDKYYVVKEYASGRAV
jgi:hypothetical protein